MADQSRKFGGQLTLAFKPKPTSGDRAGSPVYHRDFPEPLPEPSGLPLPCFVRLAPAPKPKGQP